MNESNMVTITEERFNQLLDSELWLNCLENAGVDNWEGYDFACEEYQARTEEGEY